MLLLRPPLSDPGGARGRLPRSLQRGGRPQGPVGLRRRARSAIRSRRSRSSTRCPGSDALSFGMLGCDLHCGYCQNWFTSQSVRDPKAVAPPRDIPADELAELAVEYGAPRSSRRYNEPLITSEWAVDVFREARERGLRTAYVSNGNGTPQVLDYIRPWVDFYKVDLKSMDDKHYRELGGVLQNVLDTIQGIHERGIWLEVLTLVDPRFQRLGGRAAAGRRFRGVRVEGHSLARHGIPPRLQDGGPRRDSSRDAPARRGDRDGRGTALRLRRQSAGADREVGKHPLPGAAGRRSSSGSASASATTGSRRGRARAARPRFPDDGIRRSRVRRGLTGFRCRCSEAVRTISEAGLRFRVRAEYRLK